MGGKLDKDKLMFTDAIGKAAGISWDGANFRAEDGSGSLVGLNVKAAEADTEAVNLGQLKAESQGYSTIDFEESNIPHSKTYAVETMYAAAPLYVLGFDENMFYDDGVMSFMQTIAGQKGFAVIDLRIVFDHTTVMNEPLILEGFSVNNYPGHIAWGSASRRDSSTIIMDCYLASRVEDFSDSLFTTLAPQLYLYNDNVIKGNTYVSYAAYLHLT